MEVEGARIAIINKEYLFKNKESRSKLEKSKGWFAEILEISLANEQTLTRHL